MRKAYHIYYVCTSYLCAVPKEKRAPAGATEIAHTYTNLLTHALFSTKDRQPDQEEPHRKLMYQDEVMALLGKHGVDFDSRFVV